MPQVLSLPKLSMGLLSAVAQPKAKRPKGLSIEHTVRDVKVHLGVRRELLSRRFRSHVVVSGSEHANAEPPAYRAGSAASAGTARPEGAGSQTTQVAASDKPARPTRRPRPTPHGDPAATSPSTAPSPADTVADSATERGTTPQEVSA
jgi:hypothetical protein